MPESEVHGARCPGRSAWLAVAELALVVGPLVADRRGLVPLSNTPFLFALGWISLCRRGLGWPRPARAGAPCATCYTFSVDKEIV